MAVFQLTMMVQAGTESYGRHGYDNREDDEQHGDAIQQEFQLTVHAGSYSKVTVAVLLVTPVASVSR